MKEQDRRTPFAFGETSRAEQLSGNRHAVGRRERHPLRHDELIGRDGRPGRARERLHAFRRLHHRVRRLLGGRADKRHRVRVDRRRHPFGTLAAGERDRPRPAVNRHAPEMPAIDIRRSRLDRLIRAVHHRSPIRRERDVLDFKLAGGQDRRSATGCGNGVQVNPAIAFPREDQAVALGPPNLLGRRDTLEHAARSRLRFPHLARLSRGHSDHANRPRQRFAARREHEVLAGRRDPRERDPGAIGRPRRIAIEIDTRIEISQRLRGAIVDADEAVVAAAADKREARSVRRPGQIARLPANREELRRLGLTGKTNRPDLSARQIRDLAGWRDRRAAALRKPSSRRRPDGIGRPDRLLRRLWLQRRVWNLPLTVRAAAAHVQHDAAIRRPRQRRDVLTVVARIRRQLSRREVRRRRRPHIARALRVLDPGDTAARRRSRDL